MKIEVLVYQITDTFGETVSVVAGESSDQIFFSMKDASGNLQTFESEAYHVFKWAKRHGFELVVHEIVLDSTRKKIEKWDVGTSD